MRLKEIFYITQLCAFCLLCGTGLLACHATRSGSAQSYELALQVAHAAEKTRNLPVAVHAYQQAMAAKPKALEPVLGLGHLFSDWKQYDAAQGLYHKALMRLSQGDQLVLRRRMATTDITRGRLDPAAEELIRVVQTNPRCDACWDNLGTIFAIAGYEPFAERCYKKGLQVNPKNQSIAYNLWHLVSHKNKGPYLSISHKNGIKINELCS